LSDIELVGVRQNNLKNVTLRLPLGKSIVVTGPSGSGKSSLAFETVYAEGQRRFTQSLSTYARQFLQRFRAPEADAIRNIPPSIALEQVNPVRNSRATVGTTTEMYDYLRLLFEKIGREYCVSCDVPMERLSLPELATKALGLVRLPSACLVAFALPLPKDKEAAKEKLQETMSLGYARYVWNDAVVTGEALLGNGKIAGKTVYPIVDRIRPPETEPDAGLVSRAIESVAQAIGGGQGEAVVFAEAEKKTVLVDTLTQQSRCPQCRTQSPPKSAAAFSFNSPLGACGYCKGFGNTLEVDEALAIPDASKSLARGAVEPFTKPSLSHWQKKLVAFCKAERIDVDLPWRELPVAARKAVFEGPEEGKNKRSGYPGVRGVFKLLAEDKYKMQVRVFLSRYHSPFTCPECEGARVNAAARRVRVGGKHIAELTEMSVEVLRKFFQTTAFTEREKTIVADVLRQLERRLDYLDTVGLGYLTLSRQTRTLSGGEYQRILLATQLSQRLTDTLYVLDEPSIGLHPSDTSRLLSVLGKLREQGNTLLIVEHDPEVIEWAEHVVDVGPGAGIRGGEIVFAGERAGFERSEAPTAQALRDWRGDCRKLAKKRITAEPDAYLEIDGASGNNLRDVSVRIPLERLVAVTGVSGSGKSTLVVDTLYPALAKMFHGATDRIERFEAISGFENLSAVELVDQSSIGRTSRSNPVTFLKAFDDVRALLAATPDAAAKRFTPGHFSFNVAGGRCEKCEGEGRVKIEMVFMEDVWIPCDECEGKRFKPAILAVKLKGKNVDDILRMTVDEAYEFFASTPSLRAKLAVLKEVGLGYLELGQPGYTLSGGEAQRLKIARELAGNVKARPKTLFIFDEPTTGLHFREVERLIDTLRRLVRDGHSVVVIEHNLQMISAADWVIDLGPDGGVHGGKVVDTGTPLALAERKKSHTGRFLADVLL
jgi:excinuclease ABC subunit A